MSSEWNRPPSNQGLLALVEKRLSSPKSGGLHGAAMLRMQLDDSCALISSHIGQYSVGLVVMRISIHHKW